MYIRRAAYVWGWLIYIFSPTAFNDWRYTIPTRCDQPQIRPEIDIRRGKDAIHERTHRPVQWVRAPQNKA